MKKIFVLSALILSSVCFAQTEQGSKFVGGSIGVSTTSGERDNGTTTVDEPSQLNFNVSPTVGYFIANDLSVGLMLNYSGTKVTDDPSDTKATSNTFGLSLFAKKYKSLAEHFYIFGQVNVGFSSGRSEFENNGTTTEGPKTSSVFIGISPGVEYFFTHKVSMFCSVGALSLASDTEKDDVGGTEVKDKETNFNLNLNLASVNFGFYYFF